jgi:hypothetical protein
MAACMALSVAVGPSRLEAQSAPGLQLVQSDQPDVNPEALRQLLVKGLKVTRKDQKEYINAVVILVAQKKLPLSLVYASFRYARKRRLSYPFPYFVFSLETLAKRNNIDLTGD